MAFVWTGFSTLTEQFQWRRCLKYLLIVPFLVVLAVTSYKIGRSREAVTNAQNVNGVAETRFRRDASQTPNGSSQIIIKTGGATYTRWGRTECPPGSDAVYSGIAGGSWFDSTGGGSNYLCLPTDPIWGKYNESGEKGSKLYGSEYQDPSAIDLKNLGGHSAHDHNVPCVVCRSQEKSSVVMIPARNLCYDDWRLEYSGYLMAGHQIHKGRFEYVCVDESPEADPAGYRNENGALFYNVEGVCGSLPCPPYVQRREITCAVCTK